MSRTAPLFLACALLAALPSRAAPTWGARPLREVAIFPERSAQAQVVSLNTTRLAAEIAAPVQALPVEPGQTIRRGEVVARLDCRDYELAARRAAAQLEANAARERLAALQLERAQRLVAENFISRDLLDTRQAEHDAARAAVAVERAALETARRQVEKCVLRAPFPAIVAERLAQVGEMAAPGSPLVALIDTSRIEVRAEVQAADAGSLMRARQLRLRLDGEDYPLRLARLSPAIEPASRLRQARLRFGAKTAPVGASGRVIWRDASPHLPAELLVRRGGRLGVYTASDGRPRFHPLPAAEEGRPARADGLTPESRIVVRGQNAL
jgi:RND family efflux transporter MFP subunit